MPDYVTLPVPKRIQDLRDELFDTETRFCFERARIVTRSYQQTEGEHPPLRRAKALRDVFRHMSILIRPGDAPLPVLDTTRLHALRALDLALADAAE